MYHLYVRSSPAATGFTQRAYAPLAARLSLFFVGGVFFGYLQTPEVELRTLCKSVAFKGFRTSAISRVETRR